MPNTDGTTPTDGSIHNLRHERIECWDAAAREAAAAAAGLAARMHARAPRVSIRAGGLAFPSCMKAGVPLRRAHRKGRPAGSQVVGDPAIRRALSARAIALSPGAERLLCLKGKNGPRGRNGGHGGDRGGGTGSRRRRGRE